MLIALPREHSSHGDVGMQKRQIDQRVNVFVASVRKGSAYHTQITVFQKVNPLTTIASSAPLALAPLQAHSERPTAVKVRAISTQLSQDWMRTKRSLLLPQRVSNLMQIWQGEKQAAYLPPSSESGLSRTQVASQMTMVAETISQKQTHLDMYILLTLLRQYYQRSPYQKDMNRIDTSAVNDKTSRKNMYKFPPLKEHNRPILLSNGRLIDLRGDPEEMIFAKI